MPCSSDATPERTQPLSRRAVCCPDPPVVVVPGVAVVRVVGVPPGRGEDDDAEGDGDDAVGCGDAVGFCDVGVELHAASARPRRMGAMRFISSSHG